MITAFIIIANTVTVQFADLPSSPANPTWEVARGWEAEELARIKLGDCVDPLYTDGERTGYSCLVDLDPEGKPVWQCVIGGDHEIVRLDSEGNHRAFPLEFSFWIIPGFNTDQVALYELNQHNYLDPTRSSAHILNTNNGIIKTVVQNREGSLFDGTTGEFLPLFGTQGNLYYTDYQGIAGVYSPHFGYSESKIAESTDMVTVKGQSTSGNNQLYISLLLEGFSPGKVVGVTPEGVSWVNDLDPGVPNFVDISYNGDIAVVAESNNGISVLGGANGTLLDRCLVDKSVMFLRISPDGNYIASLVSMPPAEQDYSRARSIAIVNRSDNSIAFIDDLPMHGYSNFLTPHHVTDQRLVLLEDIQVPSDETRRLYLVDQEGSWIWRSEDISGHSRIVSATLDMSSTVTSIEES